MEVVQDVTCLLKEFKELLAPYTPPRNTWNPADESLYKPLDLYRVPLEEAKDMQLKAIKYTFAHHYDNNDFYHKHCEMRNVRPDDIKTHDDLDKIPLIPHAEFREQAKDVLGIPDTHCSDSYRMCEGNGLMVQCPEGHYLRAPYTYYKPLVLDDELMSMGYGKRGCFAFLDALAQSYPGFIKSGDRVQLLEHCPVCDRPGPVLEPDIQRVNGEEMRGCAEELRMILARDLAR